MPTVPEIIDIRPIAQYLATIDIPKKGLYGGGTDVNLPRKIYLIGKSVQRIFDNDPTDDTLELTANFLYTLLGIYGLKAMVVEESAGTVSPVQPGPVSGILFPFYIHSSDFESDGVTYLNTKIVGVNISLFINEYVQQFFPGTHFNYVPSGGFVITAPGFDATQFDYTIRVERYYPIPT